MKRVGIVGLGTVGGGFYDLAKDRDEFEIHKVLNRSEVKYRLHGVEKSQIAKNVDEMIKDVDIMVETVGGIDFAYALVQKALKNGKDVVTANKALIASKGVELTMLAKKHNVNLLFSASVGGGMPALRNVNYHSHGRIERVYGILNATSNFVLSKMSEGVNFQQAIAMAQKAGYAEQDPSDDILGIDAARKISIICGMISGKIPVLENICVKSIELKEEVFTYAKKLESIVKPMVYLSFEDEIKMFVGPLAIPRYSRIAHVNGTENCLVIEGESGMNFISGVGAGKNPTAFAVMADVLSIIRGETYHVDFKDYERSKIAEPDFEEFEGLKLFRPTI